MMVTVYLGLLHGLMRWMQVPIGLQARICAPRRGKEYRLAGGQDGVKRITVLEGKKKVHYYDCSGARHDMTIVEMRDYTTSLPQLPQVHSQGYRIYSHNDGAGHGDARPSAAPRLAGGVGREAEESRLKYCSEAKDFVRVPAAKISYRVAQQFSVHALALGHPIVGSVNQVINDRIVERGKQPYLAFYTKKNVEFLDNFVRRTNSHLDQHQPLPVGHSSNSMSQDTSLRLPNYDEKPIAALGDTPITEDGFEERERNQPAFIGKKAGAPLILQKWIQKHDGEVPYSFSAATDRLSGSMARGVVQPEQDPQHANSRGGVHCVEQHVKPKIRTDDNEYTVWCDAITQIFEGNAASIDLSTCSMLFHDSVPQAPFLYSDTIGNDAVHEGAGFYVSIPQSRDNDINSRPLSGSEMPPDDSLSETIGPEVQVATSNEVARKRYIFMPLAHPGVF